MAGTNDNSSTKANDGDGSERQTNGNTNGTNSIKNDVEAKKATESEALRRWIEQNGRAEAWNHYANGANNSTTKSGA